MSRTRTSMLRLAAAALCVAGTGVAAAQAASPEIAPLVRPAERFAAAIETHREFARYRALFAEAKKFDVAPKRSALESDDVDSVALRDATTALRERVEKARKAAAREPDFGLAGGVSMATLEAIAACESGGDPTAVNAAGYYGKYQFDTGTWASVGGSGNPAEASEEEQDYRASLLYAQAGASPWPVCGQ